MNESDQTETFPRRQERWKNESGKPTVFIFGDDPYGPGGRVQKVEDV